MIVDPEGAVAYVVGNWDDTHASFQNLGARPPYCCVLTRQALCEIALEHELGMAGFAGMNHIEAAVVMIDLLRQGLEQAATYTVQALLKDLGVPDGGPH